MSLVSTGSSLVEVYGPICQTNLVILGHELSILLFGHFINATAWAGMSLHLLLIRSPWLASLKRVKRLP